MLKSSWPIIALLGFGLLLTTPALGDKLPPHPDFPTAHYPYPYAPNGCGSEVVGGDPSLVPDLDFRDACNAHDLCYGTFRANRGQCDRAFLSDMRDTCRRRYRRNPAAREFCNFGAENYAGAVRAFGEPSFEAAQDEANRYRQYAAQIFTDGYIECTGEMPDVAWLDWALQSLAEPQTTLDEIFATVCQ